MGKTIYCLFRKLYCLKQRISMKMRNSMPKDFLKKALPEEGLRHFWDQVGGSNNHATDGNKLVNILWIQRSHVSGLISVKRSHLK